jgi:sugar phosphate isomerase/epimerase
MKLSFSTLGCPKWTLDQILEQAEALGFGGIDFRGVGDAIDITTMPEFTTQLNQTAARLAQRKLVVPSLNSSVTLVTFDPTRWDAAIAEAQRYAQLAERLGTPFVRVFGGKIPAGVAREEARALAQRHLRQLAKICATHRCMPLLESHDDWTTSEELLPLLDGLDRGQVGIIWDIEHPHRKGESAAAFAAAMKPWIRHAHVKDSVRDADHNRPVLLGEGTVPVRQCIAALKSIGYDGWYCYESEKRWHAGAPEPEQSLPRFVDYMKASLPC